MKILVCVKQVPEVMDADAEIEIARDGRSIDTEDLTFDLGEWDACAVETAVRLKEEQDAEVTVLTVGDDETESSLRKALAMGADSAVRIELEGRALDDPAVPARLMAAWAAEQGFDLVLTGVMAADDGFGAVGPALAAHLGLNHATMVIELSIEGGAAAVTRELEEGLRERVEVPLPAVLAAQTGLAEPRYVSIMGIRKTRKIPIEVIEPDDLGVAAAARLRLIGLDPPPAGKEVELLEGSPSDLAAQILTRIEEVTG